MNGGIPVLIAQQSPPIVSPDSIMVGRVPARVWVSLRFLGDLSDKESGKWIQEGDYSGHELEGQDLTPTESCAQDAALECLIAYFQGKLMPDERDKFEMNVARTSVDLATKRVAIPCPLCRSPHSPDPNCRACDGRGNCYISPTNDVMKGW